MRQGFSFAILAVAASVWVAAAAGQQKTAKPLNSAHLELTTEVAATTEKGYPAVLRITIKNVGNVAIDMPMPQSPCVPEGGGIQVHTQWHSSSPEVQSGFSSNWGCGQDHLAKLMVRVHDEWIHLQPGEYIVVSETIRNESRNAKPGIIEYWAEYFPPEATPKELEELRQSGYVVPTDKVETVHRTFAVY
jgi:hypothetical protein